ncbi:hypothetical protein C6500_04590 [Candidatus Poribacteria bacterium]|nr:MAG: hypothetical protein C6500_04590 [Candidatus Poribacteria bacterium]
MWIIALIGCSAKHYAQMPLVEQDSIRLQAKAAAMADAKRDMEVLVSFGAGMSATFAAAMCGLMTGFIADATLGQGQDTLFYGTAAMSAAGAFSLLLRSHIRPPNPPPERLIGKSAEYVKFYADAYQARMRMSQMKSVAAGSIFGCLTLTGGIAIIASHIEAER